MSRMFGEYNDTEIISASNDMEQSDEQDAIDSISENLQETFISAENGGPKHGLMSHSEDDPPPAPLSDRIVEHLAASEAVLKSQQRGEPDLTIEERKVIAAQLLKDKPGQFLYRFGKYLQHEHLVHFLQYEGDPEVDFYMAETAKQLNPHTSKVAIRNRRYAALQKMRSSGDYFSETEMEHREPLLYEQLIGRHLTDEERTQQHSDNSDRDDRFSSMLFHHIDFRDDRLRREREQDYEDGMFEEEDDDEEEEELSDKEEEEMTEEREKRILREEFYSTVYNDFLGGKDKEFDYKNIDDSDAYDMLEIRARDEEERYFDEDDDDQNLTTDYNNQAVDDAMESSSSFAEKSSISNDKICNTDT